MPFKRKQRFQKGKRKKNNLKKINVKKTPTCYKCGKKGTTVINFEQKRNFSYWRWGLKQTLLMALMTGNPILPWRVRINRTPPRRRWVYPSLFHWETRSVGIFKVTYCSDCVAWRAHWSNRDDWIYSLRASLLVEIKVLILRVKELDLWYSLYGLMRGIEDSLIWAESGT